MRSLAVLAVALALAGCGGESDDMRVREVASDWLAAVYDSDGERACELFAPEVVEQLPTCVTVYSMLGEALGETVGSAAVQADALAVAVDGEHAVVTVGDGKGTLELVRTDDGWRVLRGFRSAGGASVP